MPTRRLLSKSSILLLSLILVSTAQLWAEVPAAPRGFANEDEVKQAYISGKLRVINLAIDVPESVTVQRNIEYGKGGSTPLKLDLYSPKQHSKSMPAVIFIHGCALKGGFRQIFLNYCT
jgi:hypothetical protein